MFLPFRFLILRLVFLILDSVRNPLGGEYKLTASPTMNGLKYLRGLRSAEPAKPLQADSPQPPVLDLTRGTAGFASDKAHMASATSYPNVSKGLLRF